MSEANDQVSVRLESWGFKAGESTQLDAHALNVIKLKGKKSGDIVWQLGITSKDEVERLLSIPHNEKTLNYMRSHVRGLQARADEVLCIQADVPYISVKLQHLIVHPLVKSQSGSAIKAEMTRFDVIPMLNGDQTILLFSDFDKMMAFKSLGKSEKLRNGIYNMFTGVENFRPELHTFKTCVAENNIYNAYHQNLSDNTDDFQSQEDGIQSISHEEGGGGDAINIIIRILDSALKESINDVALVPDRETGKGIVRFRVNQRLIDSGISMSAEERVTVSRVLQARSRANPSNVRLLHPADGKLNFEGRYGKAFLRMSFMPLESSKIESELISIRILPKTEESVDLQKLNIPPKILHELDFLATRKDGLILVVGPTNSGKSTTIGGMLGKHNKTFGIQLKRIAVEQPVERVLNGVEHVDVSQFKYQHKPGMKEVNTFAMALRAILRQDPDVLFVGEVRDEESCHASIDGANTGHLVFTTTHANTPLMGYRRLASFLDKSRQFDLVSVLRGILAQRLAPTLCPHCSEFEPFSEIHKEQVKRFGDDSGVDLTLYSFPDKQRVRNYKGCNKCTLGFNGMTPIHGLLKMSPAIRNLLLSKDESDWLKVEGLIEPELTIFDNAYRFFIEGKIELSEVIA